MEENFVCALDSCKGACCWKGDYGAPLTEAEAELLEEVTPSMTELLTPRSQVTLSSKPATSYYPDLHQRGTTLNPDGSCVYMVWENGIAACALEKLHEEDSSRPPKPLSCKLYPIRVSVNHQNQMELLEYDKWEICSAACAKGERLKVPVFRFVKEGLVRAYGESFYARLEDIYQDQNKG